MGLAPRKSALSILVDIEQGGQTLDRHMDRLHAANRFDRRDETFVRALVYGVLRWRGRLDWIIDTVSSKPIAKLDTDVRNILRLGLFQMMYMDRIPNSAAVNTSVDLIKSRQKKWLTGFVNAILRNILRRFPDDLPAPAPDDPVRALAVAQSMPEWIVARWTRQFGEDQTADLCTACNQIAPLTLRANTLKTNRMDLMQELQPYATSIRSSNYVPDGILLEGLRDKLFESHAFLSGGFQVQDEAAQAVSHLLAPKPGQGVLDACAGLGGKSAHMAALMGNTGSITAMDHDRRKLGQLDREMQRLGITMVTPRTIDLQTADLSPYRDRFARVLLDAPCSGLGVIRRNPDTKWSRSSEDIARSARRQIRLLSNVAALVRPDGVLVYAVCSTEPEETVDAIDSFLNKRSDFVIDQSRLDIPPSLAPLIVQPNRLLALPHRHGTDGFFAVRMRRRSPMERNHPYENDRPFNFVS